MEKQLALIETKPSWKLDRRTREIGLRGVAQARAALRAAAERQAAASPPSRSPSVRGESPTTAHRHPVAEAGRRSAA